MEFNQQDNNQNSIISIENSLVQLNNIQLKTPCFISKSFSTEVEITNIADINKAALFPLTSQDDVDILIIGTGKLPRFLTGKQQVDIQQMGVNTESMNSESACRSFNLLLSDVRNVALLLL
ncbi:Mth938-like domain-containing protein [Candidatus Thioglobus sp.]|uniref:Mth938-like domain-containing protein n=1 Tax=Candidatus Thioglobus sp. TaxID=2026721 RepID=UPI002604C72F|nr:Mth938-like domain-containing protein [Candidatus Thioglobus sp.]MDG2394909.1 Mth938-like domain-containing protein [Candidatus Thioglobus sp.]